MPHVKGRHPGTVWHRTDLQCHTPRDRNWMGMSSLPGGTPENEQGRKDWAASFVAACVAKGVSVVGITDHHDTALVPYIQEAAEWSETPVIVYPGIEVTCSDDAQSIIIVDPGQVDLLKKLLLKLPGVLPADDDDETTCENSAYDLDSGGTACRN